MEYSEKEIRKHYHSLTNLLIEKKLTISTMESITAGQLISLITDTEGSSAVVKGAFVTYSNEAKILQGVPAEVIENYTVYSKETAMAMAKTCADVYRAAVGIGVTGTAGNVDTQNKAASCPGKVFFAFKIGDEFYSYEKDIPAKVSRLDFKLAVCQEIYDELMPLL